MPFGGPAIINANANTLIPTSLAVILALGLNEGAYMAEIVRAGFISVSRGADGGGAVARALATADDAAGRAAAGDPGDHPADRQRGDLDAEEHVARERRGVHASCLYSVQLIYAANYKTIPLLIVAVIWYLVLTSVLYVGQYFIERRYGRGFTRAQQASMRERWLGFRHGY